MKIYSDRIQVTYYSKKSYLSLENAIIKLFCSYRIPETYLYIFYCVFTSFHELECSILNANNSDVNIFINNKKVLQTNAINYNSLNIIRKLILFCHWCIYKCKLKYHSVLKPIICFNKTVQCSTRITWKCFPKLVGKKGFINISYICRLCWFMLFITKKKPFRNRGNAEEVFVYFSSLL